MSFFIPRHGGILWFHVDCPRCPLICLSIFSFPDDNFSKYQWIFMILGMCIDIVEICFGVANGQILLIFDICPRHVPIFFSGR